MGEVDEKEGEEGKREEGGEGGVPKSICNLVCKSRRNEARPVKGREGRICSKTEEEGGCFGKNLFLLRFLYANFSPRKSHSFSPFSFNFHLLSFAWINARLRIKLGESRLITRGRRWINTIIRE